MPTSTLVVPVPQQDTFAVSTLGSPKGQGLGLLTSGIGVASPPTGLSQCTLYLRPYSVHLGHDTCYKGAKGTGYSCSPAQRHAVIDGVDSVALLRTRIHVSQGPMKLSGPRL